MKKGEKLEKLIKEKYIGWSIARFAEYAGIKKTTLHDITKKDCLDKVAIGNIKLIARALGMSIEELLFRLDNDVDHNRRIDYQVYEPNEKVGPKNNVIADFYGVVSVDEMEYIKKLGKTEQIELPKIILNEHQEHFLVTKINRPNTGEVSPVDVLVVHSPFTGIYEVKNNDFE